MTYLHALDLPPLYTHPSSTILLSTLSQLTLTPASFSSSSPTITQPTSNRTQDGIPTYLTRIISSPLAWISSPTLREEIWTLASTRLAERAGRTAAPALTRTFTFATSTSTALDKSNEQTETETETLEITLHEPSLTSDNLGHKTWSSSYILAGELLKLRHLFPFPLAEESIRVLELGAGTGLLGLAFAAQFRGSSVLLTDLQDIVTNLARNVEANSDLVRERGSTVEAAVLDWDDMPALLDTRSVDDGSGYDVVLAADPIYSPAHPEMVVRAVVANLARGKAARFVLGLPLREAYAGLVEELWGLLMRVGLWVVEQGEVEGFDDWVDSMGEKVLVRVRWAVWAWKSAEEEKHLALSDFTS